MNFYTDPWEHIVIDDFFPEDQFQKFCDQAKSFDPRNNDVDRYFLNYDPFQIDNLIEKFSNVKSNNGNFNKLVHFASIRGKFIHQLHTDANFKIMTAVLYLSPEKSIGTRLFDSNKKYSKTVEWKPNRLVVFCSNDNTWHDFLSVVGERHTLNYFLVDSDIYIKSDEYRENLIKD